MQTKCSLSISISCCSLLSRYLCHTASSPIGAPLLDKGPTSPSPPRALLAPAVSAVSGPALYSITVVGRNFVLHAASIRAQKCNR